MQFTEFVDSHGASLSGYARLLEGNRASAQDLAAEALLQAFRTWHRIEHLDHPLAYVRTITLNLHRRRRTNWFARDVDLNNLPPDIGNPADDPALVVLDRAQLDSLLQRLRPRERAAVVLRHYLDLDYHQIGQELDMSPATARSLVSRALSTLRRHTQIDQGVSS